MLGRRCCSAERRHPLAGRMHLSEPQEEKKREESAMRTLQSRHGEAAAGGSAWVIVLLFQGHRWSPSRGRFPAGVGCRLIEKL